MKPRLLLLAFIAALSCGAPAVEAHEFRGMAERDVRDGDGGRDGGGREQANEFRQAQRGWRNAVGAAQRGAAQFADIAQNGVGNTARIAQTGEGNSATIRQLGPGNNASVTQNGTGNVACVIQIGRGLSSDVTQTGDGQSVGIIQSRRGVLEVPASVCSGEVRPGFLLNYGNQRRRQ